ncbi:MAG: hypothetical protein AAF709_24140 [Pseudomonadota bacterium]
MGEFESRIHALETTDTAEQIDGIGEQVAALSDTLDKRIGESERRSANAIEQVGEQVATAIKHVQARQEQGQRALAEKVTTAEKRQETRLSDALSNISDRLTEMQNQTATAVSPVQRAIVSLASRLEALEDFSVPPHSEPVSQPLPDLPELEVDTTPIELSEVEEAEAFEGDELADEYAEPVKMAPVDPQAPDEDDFIAGLPDFDDEADVLETQDTGLEEEVDDWDPAELEADEDYTSEADAAAEAARQQAERDAAAAAAQAAEAERQQTARAAALERERAEAEARAAAEAAKTAKAEDMTVADAAEPVSEGVRPAGLDAPMDGKADDLKLIKGVGPKLEELCNSLGFYHFSQIAAWTGDEIAWVDSNLEGFSGRVSRDDWVAQAKILAAGGETEFSSRQ